MMNKKKLQELQKQYENMPKTYILECHSKYGVDYKLFKLDNPPTNEQSIYLFNNWLQECVDMFGMDLAEIKADERIYALWYADPCTEQPIGMIPSGL